MPEPLVSLALYIYIHVIFEGFKGAYTPEIYYDRSPNMIQKEKTTSLESNSCGYIHSLKLT